jgi:small subunit ribosomal protein S1
MVSLSGAVKGDKQYSYSDGDGSLDLKDDFAKLIDQVSVSNKKEGSVVVGRIVGIDSESAIIDVGLKLEGSVLLKEFMVNGVMPELKVGDDVEVFLDRVENRNGKMVLSREKALREESWKELEKALEEGKCVDGFICGKVKGGFTVDIGNVIAFLPGSQVDVKPTRDITAMVGVVQPFQILKIDRVQGNVVVSRRAIIEESRNEACNELLSRIYDGQILEGTVKNITDYGAFIDLGSIDGLLHVTDISWQRVGHPSEVLNIGQPVKVQVIKYNKENKRVSLGMKQLEANPWAGIDVRYPKGGVFKGVVTNITDYGAFVELEPGIEGLVHVSEISWTKHNLHPKKLLSIGQTVSFMVLDIDVAKHRIGLGIKQCSDNPWADFAKENSVGAVVEGEVKNIVDFGMFVGFKGGIDGLVHISDISWGENPSEDLCKYNKDDKVKVVVLGIDVDKERISLGIKQLSENPMASAMVNIKKGDVVTCTVSAVKDDGLDLTINDSVTSFVKRSDLSSDRIEQRVDRFAVGDRVDAKVVSVDKSNNRVSLSIKALEMDERKRAIKEYGSTDSGASLGDILGAALSKIEDNNN